MNVNDTKENILPSETNSEEVSNSNVEKTVFFLKTEIKKEKDDEEKSRDSFYRILKQFHDTKGTPYPKLPKIAGKEVDLHKLYNIVIGKGGWLKVNNRNEWNDVLTECGLPAKCVNATVAIKHLYIRYLDRYEKTHYHKDDNDGRENDEEEEVRHKRWSARSLNSVPMIYNYNQHNVSDTARYSHKLSTDLYKPSEYEKLFMSLLSPLPNEQDFAINVCTLMANESKPTLKVEKCPKLVDALLAHAGIYHHYTTREIFIEFYMKTRRHSLQSFWNDCLVDKPDILELSYDDYFASDDNLTKKKNEIISKIKQIHSCIDDESSPEEKIISNLDFLCLGRGLGTNDYIGQRVHQIASILRNLSFIDENLGILAKNRTYLRFLIMCSNIHWGNLQHMGLDMLGNISSELELNDPAGDDLARYLLKTISEGLESTDRAVVISSLEILYKLCQQENNEDVLYKCLHNKMYNQVCVYLCLSDIMLLLYTLECIYALSSLGEKSCNAICHIRGTIDTLVSLVTVEAQSYGPDACILMRVVETVPGTNATSQNNQVNVTNLNNVSMTNQISSTDSKILVVENKLNVSSPQPQMTPSTSVTSNIQISSPIRTSSSVKENAKQSSPAPQTEKEIKKQNSLAEKQAQQQIFLENEQFALTWLRQTFEPDLTSVTRIEQQDLYKLYMSGSSQIGKRGFVSPMHFPKCVRSVFGSGVGPNPIKMDQHGKEVTNYFYEGIKIRPMTQQTSNPPSQNNSQSNQSNENNNTNTIVKTEPSVVAKVQPINSTVIQQQKCNNILATQLAGNNKTVSPQQFSSQQINQAKQTSVIQQNQKLLSQGSIPQTSSLLHKVLITPNQQTSNIVDNQSSVIVSSTQSTVITSPQTQSSLIKSLLANKVTTGDGGNQQASTTNSISTCLVSPNVTVHQVAQRQQIQKQKELAKQQHINITLQNNNNLKLCNAPILPPPLASTTLTSNSEKLMEQSYVNRDVVPPLAPLSGSNATIRQITFSTKIDEDSNSTGNHSMSSSSLNQMDGDSSRTSFDEINIHSDDDLLNSRDMLFKQQSQVVTANKMLADLLEKKSLEPPNCFNSVIQNDNPLKRKIEASGENEIGPEEKRINHLNNGELMEENIVRPSAKAADLYAELAASMLEDEEIEDEAINPAKHIQNISSQIPARIELKKTPIITPPQQSPQKIQAIVQQGQNLSNTIIQNQTHSHIHQQQPQQQMITVPMSRQILMSPNNQAQVMLSPPTHHPMAGQVTQTTAKIKTETGYQTVPVLLQHTPATSMQLQKQMNPGNQIIQHPSIMHQNPNQTQYILTTNQQGQTVVLAQNPQPQMHQTVLVTQTPQQQGTSAKTIIILQQQPGSNTTQIQQGTIMNAVNSNSGTPQKVIMTTQQGQQVLVTQVPRPLQHHVIMNHPLNSGNQQQIVNQNNQLMSSNTQQIVIQTNPQLFGSNHQQQHIINQNPQQTISQVPVSVTSTMTQTPQILVHHQQPYQERKLIVDSSSLDKSTELKLSNHQQILNIQPQSHIILQQPIQQKSHSETQVQTTVNSQHLQQISQSIQQQLSQATQQQINQLVQQQQISVPVQQHQQISQSIQQQINQHIQQNITQSVQQQQTQLIQPQLNQPQPPITQFVQQQTTQQPVQQSQTPILNQTACSTQQRPNQNIIQNNKIQSQNVVQNPVPKPVVAPVIKHEPVVKVEIELFDNNWLWVCDWRGCPKRKFRSAMDVYVHACTVHCPDNLDAGADIYCQWGLGPNLCDNLPRKRFSLMTHLFDRHCTIESFKIAMQRRLATGNSVLPTQTQPVTIIKQPSPPSTTTETTSTTSSTSSKSSNAAMHAIKRHAHDYGTSKELLTITNQVNSSYIIPTVRIPGSHNSSSTNQCGNLTKSMDENEGPVTKSIRLTAALILRNLVNYSSSAKRSLRYYEPHLAGVALSNVESSRTIAQVLYEMNETLPL